MIARCSLKISSSWRVSFHFGGPLPSGIRLSKSGLPLYPDPSMYPAEVIAGYNGWIELTVASAGLTYLWVNPSDQRFLRAPTIRRGDFVREVHTLLGPASEKESWDEDDLFAEFYSDEIMILYKKSTEEVDGIHTCSPSGTQYKKWDFVFVDPALGRGV